MSRIYFHSPDGEAELRGSERAHMGLLCKDIFLASLGSIWDYKDNRSWTRQLFPPNHYLLQGNEDRRPTYEQSFSTYMSVGDAEIILGGRKISGWVVGLNTALAIGNDVFKMYARLHGQCEIHCFVRGENRAWLAAIMEQGLTDGICRQNQGWESVIAFLRSTNQLPVVCSYSVCHQFPNPDVADVFEGAETDEEREAARERWYALSKAEQWELAFPKLHWSLELKPDNWDEYRFSDVPNGFQLQRIVSSVERSLQIEVRPSALQADAKKKRKEENSK